MKKIIFNIFTIGILLNSCSNEFDTDLSDVQISKGNADFTTYVSLGNSLTAGYADGTLYRSAQLESYPNILATQMKLAGGGEFIQPLMPNDVGGFKNLFTASGGKEAYGKFTLQLVSGALSPVPSVPLVDLDFLPKTNYNNLGVPGAKSFHLKNPSSLYPNPYFTRFAKTSSSTMVSDAIAQKPTFFSLWIGSNDVLAYATNGGDGQNQKENINAATYGLNDISAPEVVQGSINGILDALKTAGATKGIIANIPDVTSIPYFTTVPSKPLSTLTKEQVTALNTAYKSYNDALDLFVGKAITSEEAKKRKIVFTYGVTNGAVILDETLTNLTSINPALLNFRQTNENDLILLPTASKLKTGGGTSTPLADKDVLIPSEIEQIQTATNTFNKSIEDLAKIYNIAFYDARAAMKELNSISGMKFNGVSYSSTFVTGGAFSLDGVHPNGRGYAIIANGMIQAINSKYGSTLPQVNPNNYTGVKFP